jgi:hypothetical protein
LDIFLVAGVTLSAIGVMTVFWTIQRHLSIRKLGHHARRHHQVEPH